MLLHILVLSFLTLHSSHGFPNPEFRVNSPPNNSEDVRKSEKESLINFRMMLYILWYLSRNISITIKICFRFKMNQVFWKMFELLVLQVMTPLINNNRMFQLLCSKETNFNNRRKKLFHFEKKTLKIILTTTLKKFILKHSEGLEEPGSQSILQFHYMMTPWSMICYWTTSENSG